MCAWCHCGLHGRGDEVCLGCAIRRHCCWGHSEVAALLQEPLVPELKPEPEGAQLRSQQSIERLVNNALDPLDGDQSPR